MLDRKLLIHPFLIVGLQWLNLHIRGTRLFGFALPLSHANVSAILDLLSLAIFIWLLLALVVRFLTWQFNDIRVNNDYLIYRTWPTAEDRIPLWGIQDVSIRRTGLGLLLGYGTLAVDSGRACEVLTYVPNVEWVASHLRPSEQRRYATNETARY